MWFGLRPPEGTKTQAVYGCRAILDGRGREQYVDILGDRQQAEPQPVPEAFAQWVSTKLNGWLRSRCGQSYIDPGSREVFALDDGKFHAIACPNGSHGYLYVGAWLESEI